MKKERNNWFIVEEAKITHYLFAASPIRSITCEMKDLGFLNLKYGGGEYVKDGGNYIFVQKEWQDRARDYLKVVIKNPAKLDKLNKEIFDYGNKLFKFGKQ